MRSLGSRLTLWYVLVIGLTVAVILVAGRWLLWYELIRGVDLLNRAEYQEIVDRVEKTTPAVTEEEMLRRIDAHAKIDAPLYFFQLRDRSGQVVFRSENMNDTTFPANPPGAENWTFPMKDDDEARTASFPIGNLRLQIAASLQNSKQLLRAYVQVCFVLLGIALVLSVFFGHRLSRMALDPVRRIQRTANRIRAGNLSERIPADNGKDEIADLARLLNRMFDRLELSFTRLWRFSADASHELRTPLSLIRLQSEKLLLHGDLEPMQAEAVQQQIESIDRLNSVIGRLLFLAKSESGTVRTSHILESTRAVIKEFVEDAEALCEESQIRFSVTNNEDARVLLDANLFRQVLLNLLSNALRFSPKGGEITLFSAVEGEHWSIAVEDEGPGLPEARLNEIFEPFVRGENAGSGKMGAGLGLAISRSIVAMHSGLIWAENRTDQTGLRIVLSCRCNLQAQAAERLLNCARTITRT